MTITTQIGLESLGHGVTRIHCADVGFADVAAVYASTEQRWDVAVQRTNIMDNALLNKLVDAFRAMEGLN